MVQPVDAAAAAHVLTNMMGGGQQVRKKLGPRGGVKENVTAAEVVVAAVAPAKKKRKVANRPPDQNKRPRSAPSTAKAPVAPAVPALVIPSIAPIVPPPPAALPIPVAAKTCILVDADGTSSSYRNGAPVSCFGLQEFSKNPPVVIFKGAKLSNTLFIPPATLTSISELVRYHNALKIRLDSIRNIHDQFKRSQKLVERASEKATALRKLFPGISDEDVKLCLEKYMSRDV